MRLTTKGRFAVTAMMDLALRGEDGPVALVGVSERQKISLSYLEQLFGKLRRCNLVDSVRGPGGGYCIARPLALVTVADIIRAVDEPLDATQCGVLGLSPGGSLRWMAAGADGCFALCWVFRWTRCPAVPVVADFWLIGAAR